jgi:ABC-type cobalamin/Fe3+-siderophores transport system ATPase subunit
MNAALTTRIELDGVEFSYGPGAWTLSAPSLRFGGERVSFVVGPNGSGKSTLLRLAAGIAPADRGTVRVNERPIDRFSRRALARHIGFLPQESPPLFDYTVDMVARMGRYAHTGWIGALAEDDRRAVDAALDALALGGLRGRPLSHLSGGERRRALIAAVLAQEPGLLLLDEPTAALDLHHAAEVMRLLSGAAAERRAVVIVTHDINLAALFGDRLLMLVDGRIAADGTPEDVLRPEVIRRAYGEDLLVREHPETGGPMVVARREGCGRGAAP